MADYFCSSGSRYGELTINGYGTYGYVVLNTVLFAVRGYR